jgi:hypothetical protein
LNHTDEREIEGFVFKQVEKATQISSSLFARTTIRE